MPPLLIAAPESLSGKTAVAVALARRFQDEGKSVALLRLVRGDNAATDAATYAGLAGNSDPRPHPVELADAKATADIVLVEAPAGDAREGASALSARAVVVAAYGDPLPADLPSFCEALGDACAGVVLTRVPRRRLEATREGAKAAGIGLLGLLPEDRTLAAPSLGAVADALEAETTFLNSARENIIDRPLISSISADPAQGYFARYDPNLIIVRGDKPDQQLGALNAGAPCLVITGDLPVLSYVEDRAASEEVPLLRTAFDTVTVVEKIESLCGQTPFSGAAKVEAAARLSAELDIGPLL